MPVGPASAAEPTAAARDSRVYGWGFNRVGQLGTGWEQEDLSTVPSRTLRSRGFETVFAGPFHSLAVGADGAVWAWGNNNGGQLGIGTWGSPIRVPTQVNGIDDAVAVRAGHEHSLALRADGTVWSWGKNDRGQLGDGTLTDGHVPVQVPGLVDMVAVGAGAFHSVSLGSDGTVWAWGSNNYGQLGDGTTDRRLAPVQATDVEEVVAIDAGGFHNVALRSIGRARAWGYNRWGQVGDGTTTDRLTSVRVTGIRHVTAISAGNYHSLAIRS